ncbi:bifunctional glutamate N-acetyltransferase/amino-acid acetyltransferase ArgJ [Sutcliffiella cohnii]|uniref:Arginine biosynthesis bifunctional protein ArgJ n=1 Tax=Sutcliffiella cohnii TaxID=33932 RepID=A0A223KQ29_9BACI|nr:MULTISPECIES: bifunctional glutamate N-acetyltransferase/amino-acid acetyltransferase ArgJ [Sutcliffiella]AST91611.1 bifunctional ornithine acetyltransferase/N-acetylglutamate synthase [Sutcliffiella cohnii]MED4014807.1 bifunctional glutamate N-acetyltransferase/amino-acid acetyltransferase ArgJ [Sutcliffiella cohnii]WBL17444.1 bifunctional glutamate N-acetyltransferase/amino-acid acetyltransferase ArgJ [Sutcliffiella sp. NC1]
MINTEASTAITKIENGNIASPKGYIVGGLHCGLKRKRHDLAWLYSVVPAKAAAVYTTNVFQAAPLKVTQDSIQQNGFIQGVIVNSGNANACTGETGLKNAYIMREWYANKIGSTPEDVVVLSTGVIGEQLNMEKLNEGINRIEIAENDSSVENFEKAILTTDTFRKSACVQVEINGHIITIGGAAKGSGMIKPNMATMLGFITTDANISQEALQYCLKTVTNDSFNMITVDGDTSTNDTVVLLANGLAGNVEWTLQDEAAIKLFQSALKEVCQSLAKQIARDGEGATKLLEVEVKGAVIKEDAEKIAKSIVGSSLVKTAVYGCDANWGRIICAAGYSGATTIDPNNITVFIGPHKVVENGVPHPFSEEEATSYLANEKIQLTVDLNGGDKTATAWGCDLSYDYVRINASYRT